MASNRSFINETGFYTFIHVHQIARSPQALNRSRPALKCPYEWMIWQFLLSRSRNSLPCLTTNATVSVAPMLSGSILAFAFLFLPELGRKKDYAHMSLLDLLIFMQTKTFAVWSYSFLCPRTFSLQPLNDLTEGMVF